MLLEKNVVGKKVDWGEFVTLSDEHKTPMLRRLLQGKKPVNVTKRYQADKMGQPSKKAWPDGKDWDTFKAAGQQRKELQSRVQYIVETSAVSKLAQDVTQVAGIADQLANQITKDMTIVARRFECAFSSDQGSYQDDGTTGHMTRGFGKWVQTAAQGDGDDDVDVSLRPPAASIYSDTKANFNEAAFKAVLQSSWEQTGSDSLKLLLAGTALKGQIDLFQFYIPSSLSTQSTARVTERPDDGTLSYVVDRYDSEYGDVEIELTKWNQYYGPDADSQFGGATSATQGQWRGHLMNIAMWQQAWNQKPTPHKPEYKGGSYKSAIEALLMLLCMNPIGEGKIAPSDA